MFGIKRVVLAALVGGGGVYFADHYHVLQTVDGLVVVPRAQQPMLRTAYADIRGWDETKWAEYPELSESLRQDGRGGLLIDGTADGLLRELGAQLGLSAANQSSTGTAAEARPPIVFEATAPAQPPAINPPQSTSAPADDSLLGRLSRQLQGSAPPATPGVETRPLRRYVPTVPTPPLQPAFAPRLPASTNERAGVSPEAFPQDLLPSIHAATMQRTAPEASATEGWIPTFDSVPPIVPPSATTAPSPRIRTPVVPNAQPRRAIQPIGAAGEIGLQPWEIDAQRLQRELPAMLQQNLMRSLEGEPSAAADPLQLPSL